MVYSELSRSKTDLWCEDLPSISAPLEGDKCGRSCWQTAVPNAINGARLVGFFRNRAQGTGSKTGASEKTFFGCHRSEGVVNVTMPWSMKMTNKVGIQDKKSNARERGHEEEDET